MAESKIRSLSLSFAAEVLNVCDGIKGHHSIVNQMLPSVQMFTRRIMRKARRILSPSFRLH